MVNLNPYESDVQAMCLRVLGVERFETKFNRKRQCVKQESMNLWARTDGRAMFWRMNAGNFRSLTNDSFVRGGPRGGSDIAGLVDGVPVFIEVKRLDAKGRPESQRPTQRIFQYLVVKAGGLYVVVTHPNEAKAFVDGILAGRRTDPAAVQRGTVQAEPLPRTPHGA